MLLIVESKKPLEQVAKDLEEAVTRHKFGVLGIHDLKATMAKKGVAFARECRIYERPTSRSPRRCPAASRCTRIAGR